MSWCKWFADDILILTLIEWGYTNISFERRKSKFFSFSTQIQPLLKQSISPPKIAFENLMICMHNTFTRFVVKPNKNRCLKKIKYLFVAWKCVKISLRNLILPDFLFALGLKPIYICFVILIDSLPTTLYYKKLVVVKE